MILRLLLITTVLLFSNSYGTRAHYISYLHKDVSAQEIDNINHEWKSFNERIYEGFDNGVYWFKIEIDPSKNDHVITIAESHVTRAKLFLDHQEIKKKEASRYIVFNVPSSSIKKTYYLRINCLLEGRIPLELLNESDYYDREQIDVTIIGIYIGIVLCIVLINLFSYFSFGNIIYVHYIFMVIGMSVNAFFKDGIPAFFIGYEGFNEHLELILNSIVVISAIFFTSSYLQLQGKLKGLKYGAIFLVLCAVVLNITFQFTGSFLIFSLVHIFHLASLNVNWLMGINQWGKSYEAKLFTIAYGLPLFLAHDYYISPHFGIIAFNLPLGFYKIGSVFEMIIFSWAIMHQAKKLAKENKSIRAKLTEYTIKIQESNKGLNESELTTKELIEVYQLTIKEIAILKDVALGKRNSQIANEHFVSENTVKYHIKNILNKFEVKNRKEAGKKFLNKH